MAAQIEDVSIYSSGDVLIWKPASNGVLTFKEAYEACRSHGSSFGRMKRLQGSQKQVVYR